MKTVVGLFDNYAQAEKAEGDLENAGIPRDDISIVASNQNEQFGKNPATTTTDTGGDMAQAAMTDAGVGAGIGGVLGLLAGASLFTIPGLGWLAGAGWFAGLLGGAAIGGVAGGLIGALTHIGVPQEDATYYNEGVRRGGVLLTVRAQDEVAPRVAQILNQDGAVNIDERAAQWKQEGFLPSPATPQAATTAMATQTRQAAEPMSQNMNRAGEAVLPVMEEELQVGKRQVQQGGVRVYSHLIEQPVEENVQLREEHVRVERRPVDRPVNPAEVEAFKEGTIEVTETAEQPVVSKQARVVEEVVVGKEAAERTETVRDTVRRTEVEVEQLGAEHTPRSRDFSAYENDWRSNYQTNYGSQGGSYEQYAPAYEYGYNMGYDPRFRGQDWNTVEPQLRSDWETRQPGTWNNFRNAIRYSWDKATGAQRGGIKTGGYDIDSTPDTRGIMEKTADTLTGDRIDDKTGKPVR